MQFNDVFFRASIIVSDEYRRYIVHPRSTDKLNLGSCDSSEELELPEWQARTPFLSCSLLTALTTID